jgi:hypothetical protein
MPKGKKSDAGNTRNYDGRDKDATGPSRYPGKGDSGSSSQSRSKYGNHKGGENKGNLNAVSMLNDGTHHTTGKNDG